MIFLQYLSCIFDIVAAIVQNDAVSLAADILDLIADLVWCTVCACMQVSSSALAALLSCVENMVMD